MRGTGRFTNSALIDTSRTSVMQHPLASLLTPTSVAIVSASEDTASVGHALFKNVRDGFAGTVPGS